MRQVLTEIFFSDPIALYQPPPLDSLADRSFLNPKANSFTNGKEVGSIAINLG